MAINIVGAVAVVSLYWGIWYAVSGSRRKAKAGKDGTLKMLWTFNAIALLGSGACFVAAALLNRATGNYVLTPIGNAKVAVGVDQAQMIAALVTVILLGSLAVVGVKRTARVKAAEVAAASIPSGYTVQTEARRNPPSYVPSFSEKINTARAESIIQEIKAGSW